MKKRILSIFLSLVIVAGLLPSFTLPAVAADTAITSTSISITSGNTYTISNAAQLGYFRDIVNGGNNCAGATIKLTSSISSLGAWTPIGNFAGTFDGGGYNINGMTINYTATQANETKHLGLFEVIDSSGTVKNLTVSGSVTYMSSYLYSSNYFYVGGIAGSNYGRIENCYNFANLSAANDTSLVFLMVGGIAGANYGTITGCGNSGVISAVNTVLVSSAFGIGGICGGYYSGTPGSVLNCYNTGTIESNTTTSYVGGIVGLANLSKIENCYNTGTIMGTTANKAGIASYKSEFSYGATVSNCHNAHSSSTIVMDTNARATITNSYQYNGSNFVSYTIPADIKTAAELLTTLNAWVNTKASTNYYTWTGGSYPVLDAQWVPPTYTATVEVKKDGSAWTGHGKSFALYQSGVKKYDLTVSGSNATVPALAATYDIYDGSTDSGVNISVSSGGGSATVNYYTLTLSAGAGTASPTGGGIYLAGKSVPIDAIVNAGYTWSKWTSSNTGLLSDQSIKATSIVMPSGAITLTATSTLDSYTINYILNGGMASNSTSYQYTTGTFTLNNPTRAGYSFLGWSGTGLTGNANTTVTIVAGNTGNRSYTANWKANAPAAPEASIVTAKTDTSLTIATQAGYEYSVNGTSWYSGTGSYTFTGLTAGTAYNLVCRKAAVTTGDISAASDASSALTVTTKSTGSVTTPALAAVTYDPAKTLADITLPANWVWSAGDTVPTVTNSGYSAVYTPTDIDTVDYSGVAGYANTSGTVTITRTIPLTVNRLTPTAADFTYTAPPSLDFCGTAKSATVAATGGISGMGAITLKYYLGTIETSPTNVGTYTVNIDIAQGDNYGAATAVTDSAWTFTIAKVAQAPLSITGKPASVTYGDTFTLATTGGSGTGAVTWAVTAGDSATVDTLTREVTITGVGATTITATRAADENYTAAVTDTYIFTPAKRQLTVALPTATGGWTKTYDGGTEFDKSSITVGGMTNKVGSDDVTVSVASATYDTADMDSGDKEITITYAIDGADSEKYSTPNNTVISIASITAATPTVTLVNKTLAYTGSIIEIAAATVTGVAAEGDITSDYAGAITYTYYTTDTVTDADQTNEDNSGAEAIGGAPKNAGTYYVKAAIAASGNYASATSAPATLTIYRPSSRGGNSIVAPEHVNVPVIVDGKTVDMGTSEVKENTTTIVVNQNKMTEWLNNAKESVVIPISSKTDTVSAQLVVQNVESMAERGVSLSVIAGNVSYRIPSGAIDTFAALKALGASDSSKVPLNVTISKLSNDAVTIRNGTLMVPPVAFTVTATYHGKSVVVERFGSYVQRVIEIPDGTNPKSITTAVVLEADGSQRHVPTEVYSENGKWYAKINAMTNSTYALIQNSVSFTDTKGKWYDASVTEMASRGIISGIGDNMFAGERAITRAEFAVIIVRALGLPANSTAAGAFRDVSPNRWYYGAVGTAYEYGLVTGKDEGQFDPTGNITRQEVMAIIARAAKLAGYAGKVDTISGFSDVAEIGAWAFDAVKFNVGSGLIVGSNGQLRPSDHISRAETAAVILRLLQRAELVDVRS